MGHYFTRIFDRLLCWVAGIQRPRSRVYIFELDPLVAAFVIALWGVCISWGIRSIALLVDSVARPLAPALVRNLSDTGGIVVAAVLAIVLAIAVNRLFGLLVFAYVSVGLIDFIDPPIEISREDEMALGFPVLVSLIFVTYRFAVLTYAHYQDYAEHAAETDSDSGGGIVWTDNALVALVRIGAIALGGFGVWSLSSMALPYWDDPPMWYLAVQAVSLAVYLWFTARLSQHLHRIRRIFKFARGEATVDDPDADPFENAGARES